MSMSTRAHKFGRQQQTVQDDDDYGETSGYAGASGYTAGTGDDGEFGGYYDDDSDEYDYEHDDDEESV